LSSISFVAPVNFVNQIGIQPLGRGESSGRCSTDGLGFQKKRKRRLGFLDNLKALTDSY
jgi:hypothetical protein